MLAALVGGGGGAAGRTSDGLPSLDPPCCCPVLGEGFPGAKEPPGMSQKGQQCGCGSPHSMTKWRKKAPLGKKKTSTQMEKRHDRLGGNSSLQNIISRASVGILTLEKLESYGHACLPALRNRSKSRQSGRQEKLTLRKEFGEM